MKKYFIVLSVLVICLSSCKEEKKYKTALVATDSLSIPVDESVMESSGCIDYYKENNNNYLLYLSRNQLTNHLEILTFDLDQKKLKDRIVFSAENGFPKSIYGFNMINKDSLIVSNRSIDSLFIINRQGRILNTFPYFYQNLQTNQELYGIEAGSNKPIIYNKGKFYFSPPVYAQKRKEVREQSFAFSYDLKTKSVTNLNFHLPKDFVDSSMDMHLAYCYDGKNVVYSSESSNDLWITDLEHKTLKKVEAKSDYFRHFLEFGETPAANNQEALYNIDSNSFYKDIVYDKYRKVYYRFFSPGIDIGKEDKMLEMKCNYPENMSIVILDSNFKKIGETVLPNLKYKDYSHFITEKGLYLYSNVDISKNYKKNTLKYTLLTLKNE